MAAHALNEKWREVFLLVAGLLGRQLQVLLLALEQEALKQAESNSKLWELIEWAGAVTDTPKSSCGARAAALAIASASARARASDIARAIDIAELQTIFGTSQLSQLPQELGRMTDRIPDRDAASEAWRQWADELEAVWLNAFDLTKEMIALSEADAEVLADYLYLTELIIRCKDSAVRVSKTEWEAIEARLLTLPESHS